MKIWKYYRKLSSELKEASKNLSVQDKYPLYAIALDKKTRNQFRKERDMGQFIEIKDEVEKEEFMPRINRDYRGQVLTPITYTTYGRDDCGNRVQAGVVVISNENEREIVELAMEGIADPATGQNIVEWTFNPFVFNDKYLYYLDKLQFLKLWSIYAPTGQSDVSPELSEKYGIDGYDAPDISYDEFETFISLYGDTLKAKD